MYDVPIWLRSPCLTRASPGPEVKEMKQRAPLRRQDQLNRTLFAAALAAVPFCNAETGTIQDLDSPSGVQAHAEFADAPQGLRDVVFSYDLSEADFEYSWQYGAAFWFGNAREDVAYIAIQPYPNYIRASFYFFTPGTTTRFPRDLDESGNWKPGCIMSADGVAGVSCHNFLDRSDHGGLFNLSVTNTGPSTWSGKFIDTLTGKELPIGEWTLPHSRGIKPGVDYFLEALRGTQQPSCAGIPGTVTTLVRPYCSSSGESASLKEPYAIGACKKNVHFETRDVDSGKQVEVQGRWKRSGSTPAATDLPDPLPEIYPRPSGRSKNSCPANGEPRPQKKPSPQQPQPQKKPSPQQPQPQKKPSPQEEDSKTKNEKEDVPWRTEPQHRALCRGYDGDDQACLSGYKKCQQELSKNAFVGWYDLVTCNNRRPH
ncbi:hypothetical protein L249_6724 [Ophiocordyceps polyrhachis-furcata BCC 54312]|uniref:Uncharacterized protein n=1 Tax=Ophiocordyceps polyrhachis-furcata BCC 54312 TaxID=1330021 RepID=A0A367LKD4_9HYPO|nr:hypothetical protein L249_6724 [Ophiocordyceps polyrhachis-furcata BCC 54312]